MSRPPTQEPPADSDQPKRGLVPGEPGGQYLDFEIHLSTGQGQDYPLVVRSPNGEVRSSFTFPLKPAELENNLKTLEIALLRSGSGRRQVLSPEESAVQDFGQALFNALFSGDVRSRYDLGLDTARKRGLGLRLKLDITAPDLARLPWEFLYDSRRAEFVCLSRETPIVRYIESGQGGEALSVQPPLQILGMVANPSDLDPLDVQREKEIVETAVRQLQSAGLVNLTWLPGATWRDMQKAMRAGPWHIFHFIGHGGFDPEADEGVIALQDEQGKKHLLYATEMGRLLADHRSLRMAFLNSCDGARGSARDVFSSTAAILVRRGLPAVLAMQYAITDRAAIEFARALYEALADSLPVDAAATEARKAISLAVNNTIEWGTPVLYMRTPQGMLFDLPATSRPRLKRSQPLDAGDEPDTAIRRSQDNLYTEGLAAFWVENWDRAIQKFQTLLDSDPDNANARTRLDEARQRKRWADLYSQAQAARQKGDLNAALEALDTLCADAPQYKDAAKVRETLARERDLSELYAEARRLSAASQWQAVLNVFTRIESIDPQYSDPENLKTAAQEQAAEAARQATLADLYRLAVRAMDDGRPDEALSLLKQVQATQPDYAESASLLARIERDMQAAETARQRWTQAEALYEQARAQVQSGAWQPAQDTLERLQALASGYPDPHGLAEAIHAGLKAEREEAAREHAAREHAAQEQAAQEQAAQEQTAQEYAQETDRLYGEAAQRLESGALDAALELWQKVRQRAPDYNDRLHIEQRAAALAAAPAAAPASQTAEALPERASPPAAARPRKRRLPIWAWILIVLGVLACLVLVGGYALLQWSLNSYDGLVQQSRDVVCETASNDYPVIFRSAWASTFISIDGDISNIIEWQDAACSDVVMVHQAAPASLAPTLWLVSRPAQTSEIQVTWWVSNDDTYLYLLARAPRPYLENYSTQQASLEWLGSGQSDRMLLEYSNSASTTFDQYGWDGAARYFDEKADPPGLNNVRAAAGSDNHYFWFEFRKPLNSKEPYDWSLAPGMIIGQSPDQGLHLSITGIDPSAPSDVYRREAVIGLATPPPPATPTP